MSILRLPRTLSNIARNARDRWKEKYTHHCIPEVCDWNICMNPTHRPGLSGICFHKIHSEEYRGLYRHIARHKQPDQVDKTHDNFQTHKTSRFHRGCYRLHSAFDWTLCRHMIHHTLFVQMGKRKSQKDKSAPPRIPHRMSRSAWGPHQGRHTNHYIVPACQMGKSADRSLAHTKTLGDKHCHIARNATCEKTHQYMLLHMLLGLLDMHIAHFGKSAQSCICSPPGMQTNVHCRHIPARHSRKSQPPCRGAVRLHGIPSQVCTHWPTNQKAAKTS